MVTCALLHVADCPRAGRARRPSRGGPHVGRQDVLFLPRCHQSVPYNGVPSRRLVSARIYAKI